MTKEREYYVRIYEEALDAQGSFENAVMAVRNAPAYVDPVEALAKVLLSSFNGTSTDFETETAWKNCAESYRGRWRAVAQCAMGLLEGAE